MPDPIGEPAAPVPPSIEALIKENKFLRSYCVYPGTKFSEQKDGEMVVLMLRKHPITQIPWVLLMIFFLFLIIPFNLVLQLVEVFTGVQIIFFTIFYISIIFTFTLVNVASWLFNVGIVTNERIIDMDYHGVLQRETTASEIAEITDATAKVSGFGRTLFGYGDVLVQTAGQNQNIEFHSVPQPEEVVRVINQLMDNANG